MVKAVVHGLIKYAMCYAKLVFDSVRLYCVKRGLQQSSNSKKSKEKEVELLHMTQYDLHKLVWHLHQSSLITHRPQHHHSHVHNVLCRQGPQYMCG